MRATLYRVTTLVGVPLFQRFLARSVGFFALLGLSGPMPLAWASEVAVFADADATRLNPVQVTAGRRDGRRLDVAQPVTVVDREGLERAEPASWTDALRGQAGAFVQSSGPGQGIIIVRGLKGSEVLHLVDGFRLNNTFFRNSPSQYIALVDPLMLSQVELLRGPSSVLYGSDAMGGVVQLLTPEARFSGREWQSQGRGVTRWSSQDLAWVGRAEAAVGRDGLSLQGGISQASYGERVTAADGRLADTAYESHAANAKLLWTPTAADEWMLSAQWFEVPRLSRYHQVVAGFGSQPDSDFSYLHPNDRRFVHGRYRRLTALGFADELEVHLGLQDVNDDRLSRDFGDAVISTEQNRSRLLGITAQARTRLSDYVEWIYGFEIHDDQISASRQELDQGTGQRSDVRPRFPDGASQRSIGLYLNQSWQVMPRWLLDAGLRWSDARTELPETDRPGVVVHEQDLTGSIGSSVALAPGWRWVSNIGRGFRAPNVFDLGTLGSRPGNRFNVPNPDLGPEVIWSVDSGLKFVDGGCSGELSLYLSRYEDRITSVPTGNARTDGRTEVQSRNIARARYHGAESALDCAVGDGLRAYGAVNWTIGQEQVDGDVQAANRVPPLNGQLGVRWVAAPSWNVDSWLDWAGRQDRLAPSDQSDNRINPLGTGGWVTVNLGLGWQPAADTSVRLTGRNLLDKAYREHGSGIDGAGRGVSLAIQQRWGS